jgi:hypothetical protein
MEAIRRTRPPENVNLAADGFHLPIPGLSPELVADPLHELTPPDL